MTAEAHEQAQPVALDAVPLAAYPSAQDLQNRLDNTRAGTTIQGGA